MLFCCHRYFADTEKRYLTDTLTKRHQYLEIGICPICKTKRVWYRYTIDGKQKEQTLKGKKAEKLLQELQHQPYLECKQLKTKFGTKNNMFWRFSHQGIKKDFNNTSYGKIDTNIVILNTNTMDSIYSPALEMSAFL